MTTITTNQENLVITLVSSSLVYGEFSTPKQALSIAMVFANNIHNLLNDSEEWMFQFTNQLVDVVVDNETIDQLPAELAIEALIECGFIEYLLGTKVLVAGSRTTRILDEVTTSRPPSLASEGITRKFGYCKSSTSPLFEESIHALESTEFGVSIKMLKLARQVYKHANNEVRKIMLQEDYVLVGSSELIEGEAYVSEFKGDNRAREYQVDARGPNGQTSDLARAMMDLHGVSNVYSKKVVLELLLDEIRDMGAWNTDEDLMNDMLWSVDNQVEFMKSHIKAKTQRTHIKKPWNFIKFSMLYSDIIKTPKGEPLPYVGVAVGLDAKGSGPQLAAGMVADQAMLAATGFTMKKLNDVYNNCQKIVEFAGITGLSRELIKKSFMAVFYGAGKSAMLDADTITYNTHKVLYADYCIYNDQNKEYQVINAEGMEARAEAFHKAISKSFGRALNVVRNAIKQAGYDFVADISKYDKPVSHMMPDGFEVKMDYRVCLDIEGEVIDYSTQPSMTHIRSGFVSKSFENMSFKTKDYAYADYARTGFVNMIQATDALVARLIVVHCKRMGAQHIIAIHDCFRVNIHDLAILKEAIKQTYMDIFSSMKNTPTKDLPMGTDILGMYFKGSEIATKEEYKASCPHHSQFFTNGTRTLRAVNGVRMTDLIQALGTTYYFDK